jgi:hypothetical protein
MSDQHLENIAIQFERIADSLHLIEKYGLTINANLTGEIEATIEATLEPGHKPIRVELKNQEIGLHSFPFDIAISESKES